MQIWLRMGRNGKADTKGGPMLVVWTQKRASNTRVSCKSILGPPLESASGAERRQLAPCSSSSPARGLKWLHASALWLGQWGPRRAPTRMRPSEVSPRCLQSGGLAQAREQDRSCRPARLGPIGAAGSLPRGPVAHARRPLAPAASKPNPIPNFLSSAR